MLALIFELYDEVFLVDEPRHTIARANEEELRSFIGRSGNWNLIAVADSAHQALIRAAVAGVAPSRAHGSSGADDGRNRD